jgi:hypothetical protein
MDCCDEEPGGAAVLQNAASPDPNAVTELAAFLPTTEATGARACGRFIPASLSPKLVVLRI